MRILIHSSHRRLVGGVERYLEGIVAGLAAEGHQVALLTHHDAPETRSVISLPAAARVWVSDTDDTALASALAWGADVAFVHGFPDEDSVAALQDAMPTVYFAHEYAGACISGTKTWQSVPVPCQRPLGPACLLHYFPHRCGGSNPVTAVSLYRRQRRRQSILRRFDRCVGGLHMMRELARQGVDAARLQPVVYFVPAVEERAQRGQPAAARTLAPGAPARLLFVGRAELPKGGPLLLDALPMIADRLGRRVHIDLAGDGADLAQWRAHAARIEAASSGRVSTRFAGWVSGEALERLWNEARLLVVPSIWPEPFGLVGAEAGARGVPAAGFAVGGIPEWLVDGENGHLAPVEGRPSVRAFADAVVRSLEDPDHYAVLSRGAVRHAERFRLRPHLAAITRVLESVISSRTGAAGPA